MLPEIPTPDAYQLLYPKTARFTPAIRAIAERHHLPAATPRRFRHGSNFVYAVGPHHVVKLVAPLYRDEYLIEREALVRASEVLTAPFPEILAEGEIEGWPYMVIRRLSGRPLHAAWKAIPASDRVTILGDLGAQIAALGRAPVPESGPLCVNWPVFLESNLQNAPFMQLKNQTPAPWVEALPGFLESYRPRFTAPVPLVLLHADLTSDNTLVACRRGRWRLAGVIDFADAMVGHPDYELSAPTWFCRKDPAALRALLEASGRPAPDAAAVEALLAWHMMHRFANLKGLLTAAPDIAPGDFPALAQHLFHLT